MQTKCLISGGCGLIGSNFVEHILKNTDWDIVVIDKLNYASKGFDRLKDIKVFDEKRVQIFTADFAKPINGGLAKEIGQVDYILHLGAETHVDNSIKDPEPFVISNVLGTMHMLNFAKTQKSLKVFLYFSTDEVFGPAPEGTNYKEWDRYKSGNPYAATKAGGEELTLAWHNTYGVPIMITHTMNVYSERQHPEKFIPLCVNKLRRGEVIHIHANPSKTKSGSRMWIHARNVADAVLFLLDHGKIGEKYNIVGEKEQTNLEIATLIANIIELPLNYELVNFHESRPGHDLRYSLCGDKLKSLGYKYPKTFEDSFEKMINWMVDKDNAKWLR